MLFNSFPFIGIYLPAVLVVFFLLSRRSPAAGTLWLAAASLGFYGYWNPAYLPLLLGSIAMNFTAGRLLCSPTLAHARKAVLIGAVALNLGLLGYYKYANFFIDNVDAVAGLHLAVGKIILPLGISFFTFTQIAFLVDACRGEAREAKIIPYVLFVTYFPHLVAGPILHHKEMMPQFAERSTFRFDPEKLAAGLVIFVIGLFKKTCLADNIAAYATPVFSAAAHGSDPGFLDAWSGALAYTFQLYFDFSGYSDMAIGISWMLGIALPLNFDSPYKARNIVDFWRRWHMTLSLFMRDYLYIALGGNRHGRVRRYANLIATMTLGGLWHGAGWTFIVWGLLHGVYLMINHAWTATGIVLHSRAATLASWALTFLAVVIGWVFFRATSLESALRILAGMAGLNGGGVSTQSALVWQWCAGLALIAFAFPNTQEFIRSLEQGRLDAAVHGAIRRSGGLRQQLTWAAGIGALAALAIASLPQPTSFIYFNF
jgi:D-alanyl-lipoteichoic acid acyltransferase DltB (MBOAT superfamily)